jgi:hypothetical protein
MQLCNYLLPVFFFDKFCFSPCLLSCNLLDVIVPLPLSSSREAVTGRIQNSGVRAEAHAVDSQRAQVQRHSLNVSSGTHHQLNPSTSAAPRSSSAKRAVAGIESLSAPTVPVIFPVSESVLPVADVRGQAQPLPEALAAVMDHIVGQVVTLPPPLFSHLRSCVYDI